MSNNLTRDEASAAIDEFWQELKSNEYEVRSVEVEEKSLTLNGKSIHWNECIYDDRRPEGGHSLWISMHGGGNCPARVNDEQYENQKRLYKPDEGIWIIPRSPTDDWNQWHQEHIDRMFDRIIENYILIKEINANRVYLLGYSAGGDGVYQLAPRMADRFAAAAMMAGHPNNSLPLGLRNLPFSIFVGEDDSAYDRNNVARQWGKKLDELQRSDPDGYEHSVTLCKNMGHWMCGKDAEALPWMCQWTRNPWPKKIVWVQGNILHDRFYWLAIPDRDRATTGQSIIAEIDGQNIRIKTSDDVKSVILYLCDDLIDLDELIAVEIDGRTEIFNDFVPRTTDAIRDSFSHRFDREMAATAKLVLDWENSE